MDKLKEHAFWIGLAAAAGILVAFGALFVWPSMTDASAMAAKLKTNHNNLSNSLANTKGRPVIDAWNKQNADYQAQLATVDKYFRDMDEGLETFFDELPQKPPPRGDFQAAYSDRYKDLEKTLREKNIIIGIQEEKPADAGFFAEETSEPTTKGGFNWENPDWGKVNDEPKAILGMQKRFWICQRIANISMRKGVQAIEDVSFFFPLYGKTSSRTSQSDLPRYLGQGGGGAFQREPDLPGGLGSTITFGFTVKLPYSKVGDFIREFLRPDSETPHMLINLTGERIYVPKQNPLIDSPQYNEDDISEKDFIKSKIEELTPQPVRVQLTCQVIDYEKKKKTQPKTP